MKRKDLDVIFEGKYGGDLGGAWRPRVYVAGPYSSKSVLGVLENMNRGMRAATELMLEGFSVFVPWHDFHHSLTIRHDTGERLTVSQYYESTITFVEVCHVLFVVNTEDGFGDRWQDSVGTLREIERARSTGVPVAIGDKDLVHYLVETRRADAEFKQRVAIDDKDLVHYLVGSSHARRADALNRIKARGEVRKQDGVYWVETREVGSGSTNASG